MADLLDVQEVILNDRIYRTRSFVTYPPTSHRTYPDTLGLIIDYQYPYYTLYP